nr:hypothetical protein CFP56_19687 [Quercus suber]
MSTGCLQQRVAQRAAHNRHASAHRVRGAALLQAGVDLDEVEGDEAAGAVDALGDEVALAQGQAAADGGAGGGGPHGVEGVDVEGEVDGGVGADPGEGHVHDAADAVAVDVVHAEGADAVLAQQPLLAAVDVAQADVHELGGGDVVQGRVEPAEGRIGGVGREAGEEGERHAVDVAAVARLRRVDVGVRVDPDDSELAAEALADRARGAGDGADRDRVVAAEREHAAAVLGVLVDLRAELLRHRADALRLLHVAVVRVLGGDEVGVGVDLAVVVNVVFEVVPQLVDQAGFDEGHGRCIDTGFALEDAMLSVVITEGLWVLAGERSTCPPEKPTATRPNSLPLDKNLDWIVGASISSDGCACKFADLVPRVVSRSDVRYFGGVRCSYLYGTKYEKESSGQDEIQSGRNVRTVDAGGGRRKAKKKKRQLKAHRQLSAGLVLLRAGRSVYSCT